MAQPLRLGTIPSAQVRPASAAAPGPDEQAVVRTAARQAEDDGDYSGARRLVESLRADDEAQAWLTSLDLLLDGAESAEAAGPDTTLTPWRQALWLVHPARRWALGQVPPKQFEHFAAVVLRSYGVRAEQRGRLLTATMLHDPLVADAALFDGRAFDGYLETAASADLVNAMPQLREWSRVSPSVLEVRSDGMTCSFRDLLTGDDRRAWLPPEFGPPSPGSLLYGRLLPVAVPEGSAFALPPQRVDRLSAARLLRALRRKSPPEERVRAVVASRRRGERT